MVSGLASVLLTEFFHASSGVNNLLLAGVERVASGADFHGKSIFAQGGACQEGIAAAAGNGDFLISGVNFGFHLSFLNWNSPEYTAPSPPLWPNWPKNTINPSFQPGFI
jgi:hypothetical protein